jgi:hypothetical protein
MFSSYYNFQYKNKEKGSCTGYDYLHKLTFKSKFNHTYIVEVEEYKKTCLFAIKFYLKSHRLSKNKYSISTNFGDATIIIRTCIDIMLYFAEKNTFASFVFIGATDTKENSSENTKRFRVYKAIMQYFFVPTKYNHFNQIGQSIYLILNKEQNKNTIREIENTVKEQLKA